MFGALAGLGLLGIFVMFVAGILLAGLVLSVAYRMVVGFMPSYPRALGAAVVAWLASFVITVILRLALPTGLSSFLALVVQFLVGAAVINALLKLRDGAALGYGKACLVELVYLVAFIVLGVIIGVIVVLLFGSMLASGMH